MKAEIKIEILRLICWLTIVIIPTVAICWFADFYHAAVIIALPFILVAERVFRVMLRKTGLWEAPSQFEQDAEPNGGSGKRP